jgi:NADH-quinone oxidoreductase subunit J
MATIFFLITAAVALIAAVLAVTRLNVSHALLFMVIMLLALAVIFYVMGAPFAAALQVIVYAGAIMVLFLFVVMILGLGSRSVAGERAIFRPRVWIAPLILSVLLMGELLVLLSRAESGVGKHGSVDPKAVGLELFSTYLLGVELASFMLLGGVVSAFHLGRRHTSDGTAASEGETR